ncbi:MAG: hypothetical protein M1827_000424 [Pycnora praestabilis]|nr:MAG: hypothetical protein M1827_000424 [Pycnora praestabilis]
MTTSFDHAGKDANSLIQEIVTNGDKLFANDEGARKKVIAAASLLIRTLETPSEAVMRMGWADPSEHALTRTAIDLNLFGHLAENNDEPKTTAKLASLTGAEYWLVSRMTKHLAAMGMIREIDTNIYTSTPLSHALLLPKYRDGIKLNFDVNVPSLAKLPAYLAKTEYHNPTDDTDGPFQYAHNTNLKLFPWFGEHPAMLESFVNWMTGYHVGRPGWMDPDFYPVEERLVHGLKTNEDAVILVDVGGGLGQDLLELKAKHPNLPGRLILQDQEHTIKKTQNTDSIETTVHDFFKPQPIKGARAYYLHSVLHDWTDERCCDILKQLMTAMERSYSKILINEQVVPDKEASWEITSLDLVMMVAGSARERTEAQWRTLLNSVGLRVVKIWTYAVGVESIIEAELADDTGSQR